MADVIVLSGQLESYKCQSLNSMASVTANTTTPANYNI